MIWKKNIYDTLISCAALCDEFATECSRSEDIESWYRSIFLNLDCADLCRQLAMLYVRGSENTRLLAKACIEVCEKCSQEVSQFDTQRCQQVYAMCQQTICSCVGILAMAYQTEGQSKNPTNTPASLFYGIDLRETLYN
ncbi:four-helix bundle copper-binding protein [Spirosoma agri]|uniref:Four-helix bundle copper-binding protein n=1 Tax=Spirosoma agri TaxID=1987381 RepID=A0A6M0IN39_9BACT|nr:four-helix bundle copper-binding protein [Spirosoma agri]NEU69347.1 four-helix bundle copper-binding protein [Spirosoma agri]